MGVTEQIISVIAKVEKTEVLPSTFLTTTPKVKDYIL